MFIENASIFDIKTGFHYDPGPNAMLIQIVDPLFLEDFGFPKPLYTFKETHQFSFLDVEDDRDDGWDQRMTEDEAVKIVSLLQHAKEKRMNVIVHCHAGLCRSGAVTEIGVIMGFQDPEKVRLPNLHVKKLLMKELGWSYENS